MERHIVSPGPRAAAAALALLIVAGGSARGAEPDPSSFTPTSIIDVFGTDCFAGSMAAPAVTGGSGTPNNPYIISGWSRNVTDGGNGTNVGNCDAHFVVRHVYVFGNRQGPHTECCRGHSWIDSSNGALMDSFMVDTRIGMFADRSHDLQILRNDIRGSLTYGVWLRSASNVTVAGNTVEGTAGAGVALFGATGVLLYHNTFVNNTIQAEDDGGASNAWDNGYPDGGNFWSDYNGTDACKGARQDDCSGSDGIGDTPYVIDQDSKDRYPLMSPFVPPNQAPSALITATPALPNVNQTVVLNASDSTDPEDGAFGLEFRWDFEHDGAWDTGWLTVASAEHAYASGGSHDVLLEVRDRQGAAANASIGILIADPSAPDEHPAAVFYAPPASVRPGAEVPVSVQVSDPDGVAAVRIFYRAADSASFAERPLLEQRQGVYSTVLPSQTAGRLEFYIAVTDMRGHQTRVPGEGTYSVAVSPTEEPPSAAWLVLGVALVGAGAGTFAFLRRRSR